MRNSNFDNKSGFTILEVMVALAIIGIAIGVFFSLIGNSSRLRGKIDRHSTLLLLARTKTEEAFLGILDQKQAVLGGKANFEGVTKDGVQWKISETDSQKESEENSSKSITDTNDIGLPPKGVKLSSTLVEGINIDTIIFSKESEKDEHKEAISNKTEF